MAAPRLPGSRQPLSRLHPGGDGPPWRNYAIAAVAIIGLAAVLNLFVGSSPTELSYTQLKQAVREGRVAQITFEGDRIRGRFYAGEAPGAAGTADQGDQGDDAAATAGTQQAEADHKTGDGAGAVDGRTAANAVRTDGQTAADAGAPDGGQTQTAADTGTGDERQPGAPFTSTKPQVSDPQLLNLLERYGVEIDAEPAGQGLWGRKLVSCLPWVLILGFFPWRCSPVSAPHGCATCSSPRRRPPPASSSSTRSTPSVAPATPAWAAATTSASRP